MLPSQSNAITPKSAIFIMAPGQIILISLLNKCRNAGKSFIQSVFFNNPTTTIQCDWMKNYVV